MKTNARSLIVIIFLGVLIILPITKILLQDKEISLLSTKANKSDEEIGRLRGDISTKESTISYLNKKLSEIRETDLYKELSLIKRVLTDLKKLKGKVEKYKALGVKTDLVSSNYPSIWDLLIDQKFNEASVSIAKLDQDLEKAYQEKLEADRKAAEEAKKKYDETISGTGFVRYNVPTETGTFSSDILIVDLNKVRVITDTANDSDCKSECPIKPLADFVFVNGGFAGINGTYICPSDYPQCENKKNSFDFSVYNSRNGKWINKKNLTWDNRALITFNGSSARFYKSQKSYSTDTSIDAGIAMTPGLIQDGNIIVGSYSLTSKETSKSTRSSIGFSGQKAYFVTARGASVYDLAYIHKAIGSKYAVAMDGGGSVAFYYTGSYYAGPGRSQGNAVILKYR